MNNCKICTNHEWTFTKSFCNLLSKPVDLFKADSIAENCKDYEEENSDFLIIDEMEGVNNE